MIQRTWGIRLMWRAFFLALGINLLILGGECLVIEQVVLSNSKSKKAETTTVASADSVFSNASFSNPNGAELTAKKRTFRPKDWMPWSLLAAGAIIVIYTYSLPRRK